MASPRPKLVVENDSFLRLIQVILDPAASGERFAAFAHFCAHDLPDFGGWCERIRARVQDFYPAKFTWSMISQRCWRTLPAPRLSSWSHWPSARQKWRQREIL